MLPSYVPTPHYVGSLHFAQRLLRNPSGNITFNEIKTPPLKKQSEVMKMELIDIVHMFIPIIIVVGIIGLMMFVIIVPEVKEQIIIDKLDKTCYQLEKAIYCQSIGMELGSIVITPSGLFGGTPYNKEACVSENSEKIIELKDLNWKKCK